MTSGGNNLIDFLTYSYIFDELDGAERHTQSTEDGSGVGQKDNFQSGEDCGAAQ